jgi:hypothetical protein
MPKATLKTLHTECARGSQSLEYTETLAFGDRKLRIRIHRDTSYLNQSRAYAEALDPAALKWNPIAHIHFDRMQTQPTPYDGARRALPTAATFQRDRDALLAQVRTLLS